MKHICLIIFVLTTVTIPATTASAQKIQKFYDYRRKETDISNARFMSLIEHTDSGWHRYDYYLHGPKQTSLHMEGLYEDSACKTPKGHFVWAYPDGKVEQIGSYHNGKKEGLWVAYHYNGTMQDSTIYHEGKPVGISIGWHPNGYIYDSTTYRSDGSSTRIAWFDNGNISSAGILNAENKMQGRWQFFHKNGKISAIELYDDGQLRQKQYFDEEGQALSDTTNKDKETEFPGGLKAWKRYLDNHTGWPPDYKITNADHAAVQVSMTIDEDGKVTDAYVSVPFYPPFDREALNVISHASKWIPEIKHNRRVKAQLTQTVIFNNGDDSTTH